MLKCALLSNINVNILGHKLKEKYNVYMPEGYGAWESELLNNKSSLTQFDPNNTIILLDGDELIGNIVHVNEVESIINDKINIINNYINNNPLVKIIVSDITVTKFSIGDIRTININKKIESLWVSKIIELIDKYNNVNIISINDLIKEIGIIKFFSSNLWYAGRIKYSSIADKLICNEIDRLITIYNVKRKKCLIVDLDNTLWSGIIGEDGLGSIALGSEGKGLIYSNVQRLIKQIKNTGILLCICSKNNYTDVEKVFDKSEMILKKEDFIIMKINWDNKSDNIIAIANELNIGIDSIVFIDDSDFEVNQVRDSLPQVEVVQVPSNISNYEKLVIDMYNKHFMIDRLEDEDINKTNMYKNNKKRQEAFKSSIDYKTFLKDLNIDITLNRLQEEEFTRALQLINKTNQFNLTTIRYTEEELYNMWVNDDYDILIGRVRDKFGDSGKTILIILRYENKNAYIDSFIMSCRVMGRHIEDLIMSFIVKYLEDKGYKKIIGIYIPTDKNIPVKELYLNLGYEFNEQDNNRYYYSIKSVNKLQCEGYGNVVFKIRD